MFVGKMKWQKIFPPCHVPHAGAGFFQSFKTLLTLPLLNFVLLQEDCCDTALWFSSDLSLLCLTIFLESSSSSANSLQVDESQISSRAHDSLFPWALLVWLYHFFEGSSTTCMLMTPKSGPGSPATPLTSYEHLCQGSSDITSQKGTHCSPLMNEFLYF